MKAMIVNKAIEHIEIWFMDLSIKPRLSKGQEYKGAKIKKEKIRAKHKNLVKSMSHEIVIND